MHCVLTRFVYTDLRRENRDLKHYADMLISKMLESDQSGAMLQAANTAFHKKWDV